MKDMLTALLLVLGFASIAEIEVLFPYNPDMTVKQHDLVYYNLSHVIEDEAQIYIFAGLDDTVRLKEGTVVNYSSLRNASKIDFIKTIQVSSHEDFYQGILWSSSSGRLIFAPPSVSIYIFVGSNSKLTADNNTIRLVCKHDFKVLPYPQHDKLRIIDDKTVIESYLNQEITIFPQQNLPIEEMKANLGIDSNASDLFQAVLYNEEMLKTISTYEHEIFSSLVDEKNSFKNHNEFMQSYFEKVKGNPLKTDPSRKMHAEKLAEKNLSVLYTRFMPSVIYSYLVNIEKNEISIACELFNLFEATKMNTAHDRSKKWLKDEISAAQRHSLGNFDNKLGGASVNTKISSFYSFDENAVPIVEKYLAKWLLSPSTYNDKSVATLVEELRIHVLSNNRNRVMGTGSFEKYLFILDYYVYGLDTKQMSKTQKARIIENAIIYYYNTVSWENSNLFKESVKITPILKHNINSIMFDFITYFISLINSNEVDGKLGNRLYDYLNTKIISKDIQMMHFQDRFPEQYKILEDKFGKEIVPLGQRVEIE